MLCEEGKGTKARQMVGRNTNATPRLVRTHRQGGSSQTYSNCEASAVQGFERLFLRLLLHRDHQQPLSFSCDKTRRRKLTTLVDGGSSHSSGLGPLSNEKNRDDGGEERGGKGEASHRMWESCK